jgi:hypothetical protein
MTLCPPYKHPATAAKPSIAAIKAATTGKTLGELLAIRGDLAERIRQLEAGGEWHMGVDEASGVLPRDAAMECLARLRAEFAFVTDKVEHFVST